MSTSTIERLNKEITRHEQIGTSSTLPDGYEQTVAMYDDLVRKGVINKKGSQLRSISDPPITVRDIPMMQHTVRINAR